LAPCEVPDDALPAAIGAAKYVAVGGQSLFWHLAAPFLNHQHYSRGLAYVYPYVANWAEKKRPDFWWFYTCLGRGISLGPVLCLCGAYFEVASSLAQRKNG
jgi:hypothetical protein